MEILISAFAELGRLARFAIVVCWSLAVYAFVAWALYRLFLILGGAA